MKWTNDTGQVGDVFRSQLGAGHMACSILARVRYRVARDGSLTLASGDEALSDLRRDRVEGAYGTIEPDLPFPRTGTDLIVLADASPPGDEDIACRVELELEPYRQALLVVGDRRWQARGRGLSPSEPAPFSAMPLTWGRAYGGRAAAGIESFDYGQIPHAANPVGRGYHLHEHQAHGTLLPNIEDPDARVCVWHDTPEPVGFAPYPAQWGLRLQQIQRCEFVDGKLDGIKLIPEGGMFDRAHPRLSGQQVPDYASLRISGTSFAPELKLELPPAPFAVELCLGQDCLRRTMRLEEVLLDLHAGWLELSYRKIFRYAFVAHQRRAATLVWTASS